MHPNAIINRQLLMLTEFIWVCVAKSSVLPVKAFMKVDNDLFSILKNGSLHGYF